jgi:hypothetical protein
MKTPREILLNKHRAAEPKLNDVRAAVLADLEGCSRREAGPERRSNQGRGFFRQLWTELVLPSRRIWSGLAAAWIVIFFLNLADSESHPPAVAAKKRTPEIMMAAREHRRLLVEMIADPRSERVAEPPRSLPRPRSERPISFKLA